MKPPSFQYLRAESEDHALALLDRYGDEAKLLAGGQSLVPMMNLRVARPAVLIDIGRLAMHGIVAAGPTLSIGALVRHRMLLESGEVARAVPVVAEAVRHIAHPTIRNHGTAGGSIAHADPTAELAALLVLLDGRVTARSLAGTRDIAAAEFFRGAFMTALEPTEMILGLRLDRPEGRSGGCFLEVAERQGDYALAAAAAILSLEAGKIAAARLVLSGAESVPVRAPAAEAMLRGAALTPELAEAAGRAAVAGHASYADIRASAEYRRDLLAELARRAITTAHSRAAQGG